MKYIALLLIATTQAHRLHQHSAGHNGHACDYVDEKGEEIPTSLAV